MYQGFLSSSNQLDRCVFSRKSRKLFHNALNDARTTQAELINFQAKYHEELERLLEEIYPSDNENSDNNQDGSSGSNDISQYTARDGLSKGYSASGEEYFGNPPSIFLQTPSKKSRKSLTESIFHEMEEENYENEEKIPKKNYYKSNYTNTLKDLDREEEEEIEDREEDSEEEEYTENKRIVNSVSEKMVSEKESVINQNYHTNTNYGTNNSKGNNYHKFFSEKESKVFSEKDTYHVLQNFEKFSKINNNNNISAFQQNTLTTNSNNKKNLPSSFIGSYSKSNTSSYSKKPPFMIKSSSSSYNTVIKSKKPQFNEFMREALFTFDFDKPKEFKSFMPHNNMGIVIDRVNIDGILSGGLRMRGLSEGFEQKKKSLGTSNIANSSYFLKKKIEKEKNNLSSSEYDEPID